MKHDRREFLSVAGSFLAAVGAVGPAISWSTGTGSRRGAAVGMCDWNLGQAAELETLERAVGTHLEGVQVSVGTRPDSIPLREPAVRRQYLEAGKRLGLQYPSVAAGSILNRIPLKSEPQSAVYIIDAIEAAAALGSQCILIAFFSNGDLRLQDASGEMRDVNDGPFSSYELDMRGVKRVIEALRQIAPRAEDHGVILGLENTLTAAQNLDILDQIDSPMVQVYYDVGNSTSYNYDVPAEIRMLGNDHICEIHIKETLGYRDPEGGLLGGLTEGGVDFEAVARAVQDIGYDGWYILETSGRQGRFVEDTKANVDFVKSRLL